jgi:hypothetical protein
MTPGAFDFPECMHALGAAFHMRRIDPQSVTITLPRDKWWDLRCELQRKLEGLLRYDGRGALPDEFRYMGFRFIPDIDRT